jgi:hypothetical protein
MKLKTMDAISKTPVDHCVEYNTKLVNAREDSQDAADVLNTQQALKKM